jgi:6-phosphogluconolactonase
MTLEIEVLDHPARACGAMMVGAAIGGGDVVLTGGSTPKAAYAEFAEAVRIVGLDLADTKFWMGDERCVPADDPRANYRMIKESLLEPLSDLTVPCLKRIKGELGPDAGAEEYERELVADGPPEFDLLLLGLGSDGHTASLFPDKPAVVEREKLVAGVPEAGLEPFVPRVTFTFPLIAKAKRVVVLATGESKAEAVAKAFGPDAKPDPHVPSSLLPGKVKQLLVLLDRPAAERL